MTWRRKMENEKVIASGGWIVSETTDCYGNCPVSKTVVADLSGRIIGKFDDSISVEDAKMIANAPNMIEMLMKMESKLSSIVCNGFLPSWGYLCSLIYEIRNVIENVNGLK